jgi:hypothetical protein
VFLKNYFRIIYTGITIIVVVFFGLQVAKAALPGDEGLTLSPPLKELTLNQGEKSTQTLRLSNPTNKLVELYPQVMNFSAKGETGEPGFTSATEETSKFSLASWISLSQTKIALTPEQVTDFKYDIDGPPDAEPGGHYGVVFFATEPPALEQDQSKVALSSMVGSLVLVKVPGAITENGRIEDYYTNKNILFDNNVVFTTRISNLGNVHFKPKGTITIKNIFGQKVSSIDFNDTSGNVLPDSIRKFENKWNSKSILVGPFTASLNVVYGEENNTLNAETGFWIIPWWFIIVISVLLVITIILVIWLIRKIRGPKPSKNQNWSKRTEKDGPVVLR